jgi:hypothetical protein
LPVRERVDARDAIAAIIAATAEGDLTPTEAASFAKLLADFAAADDATEGVRHAPERKRRGLSPFDLDFRCAFFPTGAQGHKNRRFGEIGRGKN